MVWAAVGGCGQPWGRPWAAVEAAVGAAVGAIVGAVVRAAVGGLLVTDEAATRCVIACRFSRTGPTGLLG